VNLVLKSGGLFLNHGIPDGELDTVSNIQLRMEKTSFEIFDVESLRPHYAFTLGHWVNRLEAKREGAVKLVGERTYLVWRLYMTGSALQFEQGTTGIFQILAERKKSGFPDLPLTRHDLYATSLAH